MENDGRKHKVSAVQATAQPAYEYAQNRTTEEQALFELAQERVSLLEQMDGLRQQLHEGERNTIRLLVQMEAYELLQINWKRIGYMTGRHRLTR